MIFSNKFWRHAALALALAPGVLPLGVAQTSSQQRAHSATARGGEVGRSGYLGVGVLELTDDRVKALHLKDSHGVEVDWIDETGPAAKAGLKLNDVILEVSGKPIQNSQQFGISIAETAPGTKVSLTFWRNGARQTAQTTLDSRPGNLWLFGGPDAPDAPMPPMPEVPFNNGNGFPSIPANSGVVGFFGESLDGQLQLADYFGVKQGVLVHTVKPGTPAERAGLKAGDVVIKVNGTPVMSPKEITGLVSNSRRKAFSFTVVRNKKEITLNVEIAENHPDASDRVAL
jgi:serine protease Do